MITKTFTDLYGTTYNDALIRVIRASYNSSEHANYNEQSNDGVFDGSLVNEDGNSNDNLDFEAVFWASQESFDAGDIPQRLYMNKERMTLHTGVLENAGARSYEDYHRVEVTYLPDIYNSLSLIEKSYKFLTDHL